MWKKCKILLLLLLTFSFSPAFAWEIDYLDVKLSSDTTRVWEALDLTITAMDKDNNVVDDYLGTILVFSETDLKSELPSVLTEWTYTFTLSDAWVVKFENAVIFNTTWKQDLNVYDLNDETDSVAWIIEIEVLENEQEAQVGSIEINSPESNSTITSNNVKVAGTTSSNSRVLVIANGEEFEAISNSNGVFETTLDNMKDGDLSLSANLLNSDDEVIGISESVSIKIDAAAPVLISVSPVPPTGFPGYTIDMEILSEPGLERAEMLLDDVITPLVESQDWKYTASVNAPTEAGEYPISVTLQNSLWVLTDNPNASFITVIPEPELEPVVVLEPEPKPPLTSADEPELGDVVEPTGPDLNIKNLRLTKLKTKSILDWDAVDEVTYYSVYIKEWEELRLIEKIIEPRITINITGDTIVFEDFVVRATLEDDINPSESAQWDLSEAISIQTGPEQYIVLAAIALLLGSIFIFFQKTILRK